MLIGLVADTHGFLDPRVPPALDGAELILHAGDIGAESVLEELWKTAPVIAVAGNNDGPLSHLALPLRADVEVDGVAIHLVHRIVDADPPPGTGVVAFGHSHRPLLEERDGVLYVNPGAAGRRGFHREITAGLLRTTAGEVRAELLNFGARLAVGRKASRLGR